MSEKQPAMRRGPMGGPHGGMGAGEKPKNFSKTLRKLIRYMRGSLPMIIFAVVLAVGSVILTLNVPNITGDATDELFAGIFRKDSYSAIDEAFVAEGLGGLEQVAEQTGAQTVAQLAAMDNEAGQLMRVILERMAQGDVPDGYMSAMGSIELGIPPSMDVEKIIQTLMIALILIVAAAVLSYLQGFLLAGVAQKVSYRFRRDIDTKINKLPLKYYDNTSNGEVLSYLTNDVDTISTTLNQSMSQLITSITTLAGVLVMMFRISWILTLVALVIVPISFLLIMLVVKFSQKHFIGQQKYLGEVNGHIEEQFAGHKVVQLYNGQDESITEFDVRNVRLAKSARAAQFLSGLMMPIMNFVGNISYVAICVVGGVLVIGTKSGLTIGNIQAFIQYVRQFNQPLGQMANIMNTLQSAVAAAERVFGFIEAEEEVETGDKVPSRAQGAVEFENVRFGYNPDRIIVNDFSSKIDAGARVAIVGPTGAGKTTMVKLLMRYYELNGGRILLDGTDITEFSRDGLRSELGMVLQDTWLYNGTIMDNIRYGRLDATDEECIAAAKTACADHFIRTLPGAYNFEINEEAGNVSQGQKQLLTIARAVLADPKVLILDEATSSVDTRTEQLIQKAMDRLMKGRTSFIIAHRLSTIKDADKILVMRDGDIVEQGNHEQLMNMPDGFYRQLYNSQFA